MAFTSGLANAGSDASHAVEVQLKSGQVRHLWLYDRPGNDHDMQKNKGDLWKINFRNFRFSNSCIRLPEIRGVAIIEKKR